MNTKSIILGAAAAMTFAAPVLASVNATAATDLNLRAGPGVFYDAVTVIPAGEVAMVEGCVEGVEWCKVTYDGVTGWSYAPYLTVEEGAEFTPLNMAPQTVTIETVTYSPDGKSKADQNAAAIAGGSLGALIAYGLGGPLGGIVAGGILGTAAGASTVEPTVETVTYVTSNPVQTVYLNGEVVVGAGVPMDIVPTYETPQPEYRYLVVNEQTVLVDAETGVIVDVM